MKRLSGRCFQWTLENVSRTSASSERGATCRTGGRVYSFEVKGRSGWRARYVKEVDAEELTVRFYQEVFDGEGRVRETHEKYPVDLGHRQVEGEES